MDKDASARNGTVTALAARPYTRLQTGAVVTGGLLLTALLFIVGFAPTAMEGPDRSDQGPGLEHLMPLAEPQPEELPATEEPTPETPPQDYRLPTPKIDVPLPTPDLTLDMAAVPTVNVAMAPMAQPEMPAVSLPKATAPRVFTTDELDKPPATVFAPPPLYPDQARRRHKEGMVTVRLLINEKGKVVEAHLMPGRDNAVFGTATLRAVRHWRFQPAHKDGVAVMCRVEVPVSFKLKRGR